MCACVYFSDRKFNNQSPDYLAKCWNVESDRMQKSVLCLETNLSLDRTESNEVFIASVINHN